MSYRYIDAKHAHSDAELLAQIGYRQELQRRYSTIQVFGIAFSIMGLVPSISSTILVGLESGPAGLVWGWFLAGMFILCTGTSLTILALSIPTSGGLYYFTLHFAPERLGTPLSFLIGCTNAIGLCGGICSIAYGFAVEVLSAVVISRNGDFEVTNARAYGVFAACVVLNVAIGCFTTRNIAWLQYVSIFVNVFLIFLFVIAVPVGAHRHYGFNDAHYIFAKLENYRDWLQGWSFMLSWMPVIWTIGAFDLAIHCAEEARNPQRLLPYGVVGSITVCWIVGWLVCIVCCAVIPHGDTVKMIESSTGSVVAEIVLSALGRRWAVAFMLLIAVGQYLMSLCIMTAALRQVWAFARDDGLPVIYNYIKYVDPRVKVPVRAIIFTGVFSIIIGLLVLIKGDAGSSALFSLGIASNIVSWGVPILMAALPTGRRRFVPGPFDLGFANNAIHCVSVLWLTYALCMVMFPDNKAVDKDTMNYTVVINVGVWIVCAVYYALHGHRVYHGPKPNVDNETDVSVGEVSVGEVSLEKGDIGKNI